MMVTKQQQLAWLAANIPAWNSAFNFVIMSVMDIGVYAYPGDKVRHEITFNEWHQECDKMSSKPEVDNSWHDRVELPPIGCECEVKTKTFNDWMKCFIVGKSSRGDTVIECDDCAFIIDSSYEFRPLRTEREKAIDEMLKLIGHGYMSAEMAKELAIKMCDSGYRK